MSASPHAIEVEEIHKAYGDYEVLRGLSLKVAPGEVYALLGPNGSGKTTLIHLLMGFLRPDRGRVRLLGLPPQRLAGQLGYLPERLRYHMRYSAREYLRFMGRFSDMPGGALAERVDFLLGLVELTAAADKPMSTYSKGMLQRLGVAQALLADPDLLLIDEPTSGLDPAGQREVLDILAELRGSGHTILICTHYLSEVERLCDRVGILAGGRIRAEAEVAALRAPGTSVVIQTGPMGEELRRQVAGLGPDVSCDEGRVHIRHNSPELQARALRAILDAGVAVIALEPLESPLERLYLEAVARAEGGEAPPPPAPAAAQPPRLFTRPPAPAPPEAGAPAETPAAPPAANGGAVAAPRRGGEGDTLLRELLRRNKDQPDDE